MPTHSERIDIALDPAMLAKLKATCQKRGSAPQIELTALIAQDLAEDKSK